MCRGGRGRGLAIKGGGWSWEVVGVYVGCLLLCLSNYPELMDCSPAYHLDLGIFTLCPLDPVPAAWWALGWEGGREGGLGRRVGGRERGMVLVDWERGKKKESLGDRK